jgi:phosphatidylethanolamine/phosphatidyl-N-methylethanolamine N-methyltransferase
MLELAAETANGRERVLEVAAGTGLVTTAIAGVVGRLIATDYALAMVQQLESRVRAAGLSNVTCEQADLYALRFEDGSFDLVVAANVLHLVPDLEGAIASMRRVLKPSGVLVVPTYLHQETLRALLLSRLFALTGFPGKRRFTAASLDAAIVAGGLRIEKAETIPGPFPVRFVAAIPA